MKFVYFGSKDVSDYVLGPLKKKGFIPSLVISSAKEPLPIEKLRSLDADLFVVASFGKILPKEVVYMPKLGTLNVHPSLLPRLRGPAPIRGAILEENETGVSIIRMDEKMDHGPMLAQKTVPLDPWPNRHSIVEKILWSEGGKLLAEILPSWISGKLKEQPQDESLVTYKGLIKKEDADITNDSPELAWRKVLAYEGWPRARQGDLIITEAHLDNGELVIDRVIPPGKKEMDYKDYLRGKK